MRRFTCCVIALAMLLSGCTGISHVQSRLIVHAIGIDLSGDLGYKVSYQVFSPNKASDQSGPTDASGSNVSTFISFGETLFEAEKNLELQTGKEAFFGNCELIVIGADAAGERLSDLISYFKSSPEVYIGVDVVYSSDEAAETLSEKLPQGDACSQILKKAVSAAINESCAVSAKIIEISNALSERGASLLVPVVAIKPAEENGGSSDSSMVYGTFESLLISGGYPSAAVDRDIIKGIRLLDGSAESMSFNIEADGKLATVSISDIKIKRDIRISEQGLPIISVDINGKIVINDNAKRLSDDVIKQLAKEKMLKLCEAAREEIVYKWSADVVDIGRMLRKFEGDYYESRQRSFDEVVKNTLFEVGVRLDDC